MDVTRVKVGLRDAAAAIASLTAFEYMPDAVEPPAFGVGDVVIDFDETMGRGLDSMLVTCPLVVPRATDQAGQAELDGYLQTSGPTSVKAALEVDRTLGGACQSLRVEQASGYGQYEVAGVAYYGALFSVRVWG